MERPIGIIDSGVGGLTVVKELRKQLPNESIIYIGDDKRCPYGPRPAHEVKQFTIEMATALAEMNIKMLVIACNTATAVALETVREMFDFPIIGVIAPGARAAVQVSATNKIAVLGTVGTIKSEAYNQAILQLAPDAIVHPLACPDFVPLVENGEYNSEKARIITQKTLEVLHEQDFDATILGCTHYPLLEQHIQSALPTHVKIISSAVETVVDVKRILVEHAIGTAVTEKQLPIFYTTSLKGSFKPIVRDWLEIENPDVRHLNL